MSRDLTPKEMYLLEQQNIRDGHGSLWDFMEKMNFLDTRTGVTSPLHSKEELDLRREFPVLGRLYNRFAELHDRLSEFEGGLQFLQEKDAQLGEFIETGKGDRGSYLVKWFEGTLDEGFHYSERNDVLLLQKMCDEARLTMCNWIVTDPDCLQVRRQVGYEDRGIFQLMQVNFFGEEKLGDSTIYQLASAEIDLADYSQEEIIHTLGSYGYESFKDLVEAAGSRNEAFAQLSEMLFEDMALECHVMKFTRWNEALDEVQKRTGVDLSMYREIDDKELHALIQSAAKAKKSGPARRQEPSEARLRPCMASADAQREKTSCAEHEEVL